MSLKDGKFSHTKFCIFGDLRFCLDVMCKFNGLKMCERGTDRSENGGFKILKLAFSDGKFKEWDFLGVKLKLT